MKRILTLIAVFLLAALGSNVFAQKNSTDDYNLRKAYEVLKENNDRDEALKLLGETAGTDSRQCLSLSAPDADLSPEG